jgi:hypothetical protein
MCSVPNIYFIYSYLGVSTLNQLSSLLIYSSSQRALNVILVLTTYIVYLKIALSYLYFWLMIQYLLTSSETYIFLF